MQNKLKLNQKHYHKNNTQICYTENYYKSKTLEYL